VFVRAYRIAKNKQVKVITFGYCKKKLFKYASNYIKQKSNNNLN